jgi:hypothetical protein
MVISNQNQKTTNYLSLADICADKGYVCHDLEIPNEDEFLSTEKFLDINDTEFLLNYVDYRILRNELEEICSLMGISRNEILSLAVTLLEIHQKAENNNKLLAIIDSENNVSPIKIQ